MYSSVKRFLKQTSNHDLMVEYASHRIMGEEPPPEISKRIAQALGRHMRRPTQRNLKRFFILCLGVVYQEIREAGRNRESDVESADVC